MGKAQIYYKSKAKRKTIIILTVIASIFFAFAVTVLAINGYMISSTNDRVISVEEALNIDPDCILVLGAGVWGDRPSPMLEDRLLRGIQLYNNGISDRIVVSGDHGREGYDEVNVMKRYAVAEGVPSNHIFMDHAGFTTYDSIYRLRDIFQAKKVIIVTQEYHLYRALYIARSLGLDAYGVSSDPRLYAGQGMRNMREAMARVKAFGMSIIKPEPYFLGEAIPVTGNGDVTND
ncbi:MAG: SanA/YdcF family protein [Anaerovoracaceae bacterium]|jgi:SanA protein